MNRGRKKKNLKYFVDMEEIWAINKKKLMCSSKHAYEKRVKNARI